MNFIALIFAFSFSLFHLSDTYVVEHYEKEIREVYVSQHFFVKKQIKDAVENVSFFTKAEESFYYPNYNFVPVTKYLFLKIRVLLL